MFKPDHLPCVLRCDLAILDNIVVNLKPYQQAYEKTISPGTRDLWKRVSEELFRISRTNTKELKRSDLAHLNCDQEIAGSGSEAFVLWSQEGDGLGKIRYRPDWSDKTRKEAEALAKASEYEIERVPKLLAYNRSNIVARSFCKGEPLASLAQSDLKQITSGQLKDLFKVLDQLIALNCHIDESEGNFLYDANYGFSVIDFSLEDSPADTTKIYRVVREIFVDLGIEELFDRALADYHQERIAEEELVAS